MTRQGGTEIINRARLGDSQAMSELWQNHRRWIAAILLAYKPVESELEDLLQEVAAAFVKSIRSLRDPAKFRSWLRSLAIQTATSELRGATRRRNLFRPLAKPEDLAPAAGTPQESDLLEAKAKARELLRHLQHLPAEYREPLVLKGLHGMSQRAIAESLDLPETTIETRLARARRMLRKQFAKHESRDSQGISPL